MEEGKSEQLNIDETFERLDEIIGSLENHEGSLEDAFTLYETGMKLVKSCNAKLDKVEKQIQVLNEELEEDGI